MQLLLAPMEGLLDFALRDTLTRANANGAVKLAVVGPHPSGIDRCVSEFIRITDTLLPPRAFIRTMPELLTGGRTLSGVPVRGQLLGSDPTLLAENAARLVGLGSHGVDLNFGCPAKVVNRHGGGSALLDDPEQVHRIVAAVRRAVPAHVPVSAKMRLGFNDDHRAEDNACAIEDAGASEIVVHARTKAHGYRPPAYWERIGDLRGVVKLPLVANGEIWTVDDALRAQAASGCTSLMLGRGMVADPGLALAIRTRLAGGENFDSKTDPSLDGIGFLAMNVGVPEDFVPQGRPGSACAFNATVVGSSHPPAVPWPQLWPLMQSFWALVEQRVERRHRAGRLKQWLNLLRRRYPEAQTAFDELRTTTDPQTLGNWLARLSDAAERQASGV
jgi:tRNA-dihydrouridine synthase C